MNRGELRRIPGLEQYEYSTFFSSLRILMIAANLF